MKNQALKYLILCCVLASAQASYAEPANSGEDSDDQYLFHPDESKLTDFDTDVDPLHEESLQGFDCMDRDGDGYLTVNELEDRDKCADNLKERGMEASARTALVLDQMDSDRDSRVSKREFNIWNDMKAQQN